MTPMLEKAARALAAEDARRYEESSGRKIDLYAANPDMHQRLARAVLMAVREPGVEMVMDAQDSIDEEHGVSLSVFSVSQSFTAMIDAILSEGAQ